MKQAFVVIISIFIFLSSFNLTGLLAQPGKELNRQGKYGEEKYPTGKVYVWGDKARAPESKDRRQPDYHTSSKSSSKDSNNSNNNPNKKKN